MKKFTLLLTSALSIVVLAGSAHASLRSTSDGPDSPPPIPSQEFDFSQAQVLYESARAADLDSTQGYWWEIGETEIDAPGTLFSGILGYNPYGLKNQDGTTPALQLRMLAGISGNPQPMVGLFSLGNSSANQGPYLVARNEYGVAFSQFGYKNGFLDQDPTHPYFSYTCRLTKDDSLICELRFEGEDPSQVDDSQRPYLGLPVIYSLYKR